MMQECQGDYRPGKCQGVCHTLQDCGSCTVQGQGASVLDPRLKDLWHSKKCAWCVKEGTCQVLDG